MANVVEIILKGTDKTKEAFTAVNSSMDDLRVNLAKVAPFFTGLATTAASAMAVAVKAFIDTADEAGKTAQKIGLTVEAFSTLEHAADLSGVKAESLTKAFIALSKEVESGGSSLKAIGVQLRDGAGQLRTNDALLLEVADKFSRMEDGAQKTAIAMQLFGKAGADMIPLLNGGADAIERAQEEARKLGLEISGGASKAAEQFNDNLSRLKASTVGVVNSFANELLPTLTKVSDAAVELHKNTESLRWTLAAVGSGIGNFFKEVATKAYVAAQAIEMLGTRIGGASAVWMQRLSGNHAAAEKILADLNEKFAASAEQTKKTLEKLWSGAVPDEIAAPKIKPPDTGGLDQQTYDAHLKLGMLEFDPGANRRLRDQMATANLPSKTLDLNFEMGNLEYDPNLPKRLEDTKKFYEDVNKAFSEATKSRIDLIEGERQAQLIRLSSLVTDEGQAADARKKINETYDQQRADAELNAFVRAEEMAKQSADLARRINADGLTGTAALIAAEEERYRRVLDQINTLGPMEDEFYAMREAAYTAHKQKLADIDKSSADAKLALEAENFRAVAGVFGDLAGVAQAFGKKGFAAFKAFASAQAIIDTYSAAIAAYKAMVGIPVIGPGLAVAAAAAAVAFGVARVAAINSTQPAGVAHSGLDWVPNEGTYVLQAGERVLAPTQNRDLTHFLRGVENWQALMPPAEMMTPVSAQNTFTTRVVERTVERVRETQRAQAVPSMTPARVSEPATEISLSVNTYIGGDKVGEALYRLSRDGQLNIHPRAVREA